MQNFLTLSKKFFLFYNPSVIITSSRAQFICFQPSIHLSLYSRKTAQITLIIFCYSSVTFTHSAHFMRILHHSHHPTISFTQTLIVYPLTLSLYFNNSIPCINIPSGQPWGQIFKFCQILATRTNFFAWLQGFNTLSYHFQDLNH